MWSLKTNDQSKLKNHLETNFWIDKQMDRMNTIGGLLYNCMGPK